MKITPCEGPCPGQPTAPASNKIASHHTNTNDDESASTTTTLLPLPALGQHKRGPPSQPSPTTCSEQMSPQRSQHLERTYTKPHHPLARIPRPPTTDVGTEHTLIPPGQPTSRKPGNRRHRLTTPPPRVHISANQRHEGREPHPHETSQTTDQDASNPRTADHSERQSAR